MRNIKNFTAQKISLEGFGFIEIEESFDGIWHIDLFPRNSSNDREKIRLETTFSSTGDKYFEMPKKKDRTAEIYDEPESDLSSEHIEE